jgi:hypothetical protein
MEDIDSEFDINFDTGSLTVMNSAFTVVRSRSVSSLRELLTLVQHPFWKIRYDAQKLYEREETLDLILKHFQELEQYNEFTPQIFYETRFCRVLENLVTLCESFEKLQKKSQELLHKFRKSDSVKMLNNLYDTKHQDPVCRARLTRPRKQAHQRAKERQFQVINTTEMMGPDVDTGEIHQNRLEEDDKTLSKDQVVGCSTL